MRIVIDMKLSAAWLPALRAAGFEAIHWSEIGARGAADDEIVASARANTATVLTRDLDFAAAITRSGTGAPNVIQLRIGHMQLERHMPLKQGAIVTLEEQRIRVRTFDRDGTP